ncbi:hypothetical protein ACMD2_23421 [Ananas comosus]|uniref:F-box domain-containing protein n=1 Tax=Ananas comosus TaxID=4615 RepID=A0A199VKB6_ANACO|nr:hypothetical protein ACMD2_23421 [Ananas comosus]
MSAATMVSNILSHYPFLSSLTVVSSGHAGHPPPTAAPSLSSDDHLLLLEEILRRLPPSSSSSVLLVSKRWLFLHRSSTTSLSLRIPSSPFPLSTVDNNNNNNNNSMSAAAMVSNILSYYPFLSRLTVVSSGHYGHPPPAVTPSLSFDDHLLVAVVGACSRRLSHLRFHPADDSPLSHLTSLHISALLPISFYWLKHFRCLISLSLVCSRAKQLSGRESEKEEEEEDDDDSEDTDREILVLPLESLSLSGIRSTDSGLSWLWRRCGGLRRLQLRAYDGTGPPSSFALCLAGLLCLELRTCRAIADRVLYQAAEHCRTLTILLLYDGGDHDALRQFIHQRGAALRVLDLRLPLDLHNDHLFAIALA